ncbi:MAG: hypothetical protein KKA07_11865 [Bacteroidetes bacterium]|nr:hypothetical protein [Bacteroidota bacterium]MBU1719754.1 hypothetical protein [Bacteroidota bacterium]
MKIRLKILLGFLLLASLLMAAGAYSIYEFVKVSRSVNSLIDDNYKTIEASRTMLEALEREDSGILLLILGEWGVGHKIISSADSSFLGAKHIAENNLTEEGEDLLVAHIGHYYTIYKNKWQHPNGSSLRQGNIVWYLSDVHQNFLAVKKAVNDLMELNQTSMHTEAKGLSDRSKRAIMPGIVAIIAALIFSFILNFFISSYLIRPIRGLSKALKSYFPGSRDFDAGIKTKDEFKQLETRIQEMISRMESKANKG